MCASLELPGGPGVPGRELRHLLGGRGVSGDQLEEPVPELERGGGAHVQAQAAVPPVRPLGRSHLHHHSRHHHARSPRGSRRRRHPGAHVPLHRQVLSALRHPLVQGHHLRRRRHQQLLQRAAETPLRQPAAGGLQHLHDARARAPPRHHPRRLLQRRLAGLAHHNPPRLQPDLHHLPHQRQGRRDVQQGGEGGEGGGDETSAGVQGRARAAPFLPAGRQHP
mmetsp:Transcript_13417/g.30907  ORF Transcript_13417/g.30907 Transcript_13417/m.30907 type:complete len:222 (+) Transcript_13417:312-977(+)